MRGDRSADRARPGRVLLLSGVFAAAHELCVRVLGCTFVYPAGYGALHAACRIPTACDDFDHRRERSDERIRHRCSGRSARKRRLEGRGQPALYRQRYEHRRADCRYQSRDSGRSHHLGERHSVRNGPAEPQGCRCRHSDRHDRRQSQPDAHAPVQRRCAADAAFQWQSLFRRQ